MENKCDVMIKQELLDVAAAGSFSCDFSSAIEMENFEYKLEELDNSMDNNEDDDVHLESQVNGSGNSKKFDSILHVPAVNTSHLKIIEAKIDNLSREIAGLHVKFDKILDFLANSNSSRDESTNDNCLVEFEIPMKTIEVVNLFEEKLAGCEFRNALYKHMSTVCGTSGDKNGTKVAYKLVDLWFSRQLLLQFSWTGSSKTKEKKEVFLKLKNIGSIFFKIINSADNRFSQYDTEMFFRKVLRNSFSRSNQVCMKRKLENGSSEDT